MSQRAEMELREAVAGIAADLGIEAAALMAVVEVESGGKLFAQVNGRDEPLIRFEGHYFHRLLPAVKRNHAVISGLAHPVAGKVRNPLTQAGRWRLLARACEIDREAGLCSVSWGVGQVMGAHWRWLGYAGVEALVAEARSDLEGQVRLFARFVEKAGLKERLNAHDWAGFARAYNGPAFARHGYHTKMAAAYGRIARPSVPRQRHAMAVLSLGAQGAAVEALQRDLRRLGHPLIADGDFGPATERALKAFQRSAAIAEDGVFGAQSLVAMSRLMAPARLT
jgi:hypothetical protein